MGCAFVVFANVRTQAPLPAHRRCVAAAGCSCHRIQLTSSPNTHPSQEDEARAAKNALHATAPAVCRQSNAFAPHPLLPLL
jgi:hypothetical protein